MAGPRPRIILISMMLACVFAAGIIFAVLLIPPVAQSSSPSLELLIRQASHGKARLLSTFEGPNGMTGLVLKGMQATSKELIAWKPARADVLVIGRVFGSDGTEYTQQAARRIFGEATAVDSEAKPQFLEALYQQALQGGSSRAIAQFDLESFKTPLMVFFDPNCTHCHRLRHMAEENRELFMEHEVEILWMPVAFDPVSEKRAAALLLEGFVESGENVGITDDAISAVRINSRLAKAAMPDLYTPMMMWRQVSGRVDTLVGAPESLEVLMEIVNRITR